MDLHADGMAAGEGDAIKSCVGDQRFAGCRTTGQESEHARRHPGLQEGLYQQGAGQRIDLARLVDHRVAGRQGGRDHVDRERHREVERRDHAEDAIGAQQRAAAFLGFRTGQQALVAEVPLHLGGVIAGKVGRFLGLAHRFQPRFADLQNQQRAHPPFHLGQNVTGPPDDCGTLRPGQGGPGRLGRPGDGDRACDRCGVRLRHLGQEHVAIDRAPDGGCDRPGHGMSVHQGQDGLTAEAGLQGREKLVQPVVHRAKIGAGVGIGDTRRGGVVEDVAHLVWRLPRVTAWRRFAF